MIAPFPSTERFELEHVIEQSDLALCAVSRQGVLRCPDMPYVVNQEKSGTRLVIVTFVAPPKEVRPYDVSHATVSLEAEILRRRSNYLFVTIGAMTLAQMSLLMASIWESGLSPTSRDHSSGTILLAISLFGFLNHTIVGPTVSNEHLSRSDFITYVLMLKKDHRLLDLSLLPGAIIPRG
ncbi:hypothetical protein BJV77DRAFT_378567 [Russula vinacea]|nr:hypothetical protein BJV77DRAFT_378567 [Russula vinacea]